jgi:hypothetical protein
LLQKEDYAIYEEMQSVNKIKGILNGMNVKKLKLKKKNKTKKMENKKEMRNWLNEFNSPVCDSRTL